MDTCTLYNEIGAGRADLETTGMEGRSCQIIVVAIPEDEGVRAQAREVQKYQDLTREVQSISKGKSDSGGT